MLAILDPELRRGAPSRKQTVGLVSALTVMSLVVGAAVPVARAADSSAALRVAEQPTPQADDADDSTELVDRAVTKTVQTVEQKQLTKQVSQDADTARRKRGEIGAAVGSAIGKEIGPIVGEIAGAAASAAVGVAVKESSKTVATTFEELAARINSSSTAQGRSDDRPALLANVLRTDTSAALRRVAAWGLANFGDQSVSTEALARAVTNDRDASVREMAAWALAHSRRSNEAVDGLSTALRRDASPKVRATAAWALGHVGDEDAVEALASALSDTARGVKLRAAWALGHVGRKSAPRQLLTALSDSDAEVRKLAAWALFNIQDPEAVEELDAAMRREKDKDTQRAIIRALAATGERSVDAIKRLIDSSDPEVRAAAIRALAGGRASGPWPWPWPEPRPQPW